MPAVEAVGSKASFTAVKQEHRNLMVAQKMSRRTLDGSIPARGSQ